MGREELSFLGAEGWDHMVRVKCELSGVFRLSQRSADSTLVDEVIQDTFIADWRKPQGFGGEGDVGAWLWGIAIRKTHRTYRGHEQAAVGLRSYVRVGPELPYLLCTPAGDGDLGSPFQRLLG